MPLISAVSSVLNKESFPIVRLFHCGAVIRTRLPIAMRTRARSSFVQRGHKESMGGRASAGKLSSTQSNLITDRNKHIREEVVKVSFLSTHRKTRNPYPTNPPSKSICLADVAAEAAVATTTRAPATCTSPTPGGNSPRRLQQ